MNAYVTRSRSSISLTCCWFPCDVQWGRHINIEPLLVCMIAAIIAGNGSKNRRKFANILHKSAPYVFVPFFLLTGASFRLDAIVTRYMLEADHTTSSIGR